MKRLFTSPIILAPFTRKLLFVSAASVGVVFGSATASASQPYPNRLKSVLDASAAPPCNICHMSAGGGDAIVGAFGKAMKAEGLTGGAAYDTDAKMQGLLDGLGEDTDSDKGGESDIAELTAGRNPSSDDDDEGAAGGAGGAGGGGTGGGGNKSGTGGGGDDEDDDEDDDDAAGSNPGASGQATSAGCSYGVLDSSTKVSSTAALLAGGAMAVTLARRRKRR